MKNSDNKNASTEAANETVTADANTVLIRFLLSPCGAFLLPWNVGDEVEINVNQAQEMVEAKYAEYVN